MKPVTRLSLATLLCATLAHAQSAPQPQQPAEIDNKAKIPVETVPAGSKPVEEEGEALLLSPFEVTATKDTGYQSTQTLAGTRIRTDLKDIASSISVINKDMMSDIGATDNATLLQYTTNAEVAGSRGSYAGTGYGTTLNAQTSISGTQRVRGLTSADQTRDFFATNVPWDTYNSDRIDIQRGPNAILFGLGSPAGIINSSSRNAEFQDKGSVEFKVASYGSKRIAIDANKELIKGELALRVDILSNNEQFQQQPAFKDDERVYGAVRWDPKFFGRDFASSFKVKAEKGKIVANMPRNTTPYDNITPWFTDAGKIAIGGGSNYSVYDLSSNAGGVSPWLKTISGQQTPTFLLSGTTGEIYQVNAGYVNNRFLNSSGSLRGQGDNAVGQRYSEMFYGIGGYRDYVTNMFPTIKPYWAAMTSNKMLTDKSVFDFYNKLIDGDNKRETADWTAYNLSFTQNGWGDRVGLELNYDYQKYTAGSKSLLGGAPTISIDVTNVLQDNNTNMNYGRPYVTSTAGGTGSSTVTERKASRASLFGEFRATDFIKNDFLVKLIGKHRFNGVASSDTVNIETRNWNRYANSNAWDAYTTLGSGFNNNFANRAPLAVLYLGNSLSSASRAADIPAVTDLVDLRSGNVYLFDATWTAPSTVSPGAAWNPADPAYSAAIRNYYAEVFNIAQATTQTQASNPANYKGWSNERYLNLLSYDNGDPLYTSASKSQRITSSYAGSWQGFMWNQGFIPTLGWRYDKVKSTAINASQNGSDRNFLRLDGSNYALPAYNDKSYYKGHSVSGGAVLHLNKFLPTRWDESVPFNLSLSYNSSSNFQVGGARVDMYNNPLSNPQGKTKEFGVQVSTKDNKYSLRVVQYETTVKNATVSTDSGFFGTLQQGLKFRNVFLYQLSGYTLNANDRTGYTDTRTGPYVAGKGNSGTYVDSTTGTSYPVTMNTRWYWTPAYVDADGKAVQTKYYTSDMGYINQTVPAGARLQTWDETVAMRDASITAWNNIQRKLEADGFFTVWNMTPTTSSALTDRATYEQSLRDNGDTNSATGGLNPANAAYQPVASTVANYGGGAPAGFAITGDQQSKGYEFELTANITRNWRLAFNASKTTATATRIGDKNLEDFVTYMDAMIAGPAGEMRQYNGDYVWSNSLRKKWLDWRGNWTYLKLQEQVSNSEVRKWRYNVVTNYSFSKGWLKGFGAGAAYRWQDKVVIGYPVYLDSLDYAHYDTENPVYGSAEDGVDLWLSYQRKITNKIEWKIQFNVRNLLLNNGLAPVTVEPDGQTWAGVRIKPTQEWSVTNTFSF
ncbi:MAG: TonB-dependent receptor plug domain-containing protein [Verrucomicrobia bacterium]|nr:TonB-dependent receptor plug domain-containing protein [Verrucomicrobiota bacterium]